MALVGMQDVSVGFGGQRLLEHMNLQFEAGERICLLGRNGVGKSTLLKLMTGQVQPDEGIVSRAPLLKLTCLIQDVPSELAGTVFDSVSAGLGERGRLLAQYHQVSHQLAADHDNPALLAQLDKYQHALDAQNSWEINRHVEMILQHMELEADAEVTRLSAGMKRRVLLAQALVREPDLLLLDEPTNHLDIVAITWIEEFLVSFRGALVFVSHDRAFIRRLATRIIELDRGQAVSYLCDYDTFLARKEIAEQARAAEEALFDKKLAQEEVWIRKGIKARRTRNEGRVRALEKMRREQSQRREAIGTARMSLQDARNSGQLVIEARNICFEYEPQKPIVADFSTTIMRGDKIGIIGPNGSGKTTLLRVLLKELAPQAGMVRHGTNLEIAYFDQLHAQLNYEQTVYENIAEGNETVMINGTPRHIIGYLEDFLFTPKQSRNPVANLSGGERNRLLLARLFIRPSNVLVLDEPTNDLDIETLDLLEELLLDYAGTVLMVSHDREFLDNVVTSIMSVEAGGIVEEYVGGYHDWLAQRARQPAPEPEKTPAPVVKTPREKTPARGLSYAEKKELQALPARIESWESELLRLHAMMADPDFYKKGAEAAFFTSQAAELTRRLAEAYSRWQELEDQKRET